MQRSCVLSVAIDLGRVGEAVSRGCSLDHLAGAVAVARHVMEAVALNVIKEAGSGSFGLKDVAMGKDHGPPVAQVVVTQIDKASE